MGRRDGMREFFDDASGVAGNHLSLCKPLYTKLVMFPLDHGGAVVSTPDPTLSFDIRSL